MRTKHLLEPRPSASGLRLFLLATTLSIATAQSLPFTIEPAADVSARFPGAPRLHSFAWAQWEGKWIFIAGRTSGYHGVGGAEADFSKASANTKIWVIDPTGDGPARTYSFPVADLPAALAPVKSQWISSNVLFLQDNDILYIAGGYGQNTTGGWVTHSVLSAVHLPSLIEAVMHTHDTLSSSISFIETPLVQTSGGEMLKLDDGLFYLAGGHIFTGTYGEFEGVNEKNSAAVSQIYTSEIRKLRITRDARSHLTVTLVDHYRNREFARRDLNAALRILPDGHTLGAAIYGGVFTQDQLNFTKPIYWTASTAPQIDDTFEQKMTAYTCAHLQLYDPDSHAMYTTFFGGISRWTWNRETHSPEPAPLKGTKSDPVYHDGLAWIDSITTLVQESGKIYEITDAARLPAYLGTDAAFIPAPGLAKIREDADIFNLAALRGKRILAGYLYGGIKAFPKQFPYHDDSQPYRSGNVPTKASDLIIPIYLTIH